MRKDAEEKKLPPIYRGKWASASAEEVQAMKDKGVPFCYRFRVPKVRAMRGGGGGGASGGCPTACVPKVMEAGSGLFMIFCAPLPWCWSGEGY